jgi:hypothetical protein
MPPSSIVRLVLLLSSALLILLDPAACRPPSSDELGLGSEAVLQPNRADSFELGKELQYLKERTAELAVVADRVKAVLASRQGHDSRGPQGTRGITKRHCWDVADVCCMWSIC